jgi:hypothetical protein
MEGIHSEEEVERLRKIRKAEASVLVHVLMETSELPLLADDCDTSQYA